MFGTNDGPLLAIPYDFDMSGFVHTPYARPETGLGIDDVRQRLYQGFCVNNRYGVESWIGWLKIEDKLKREPTQKDEYG